MPRNACNCTYTTITEPSSRRLSKQELSEKATTRIPSRPLVGKQAWMCSSIGQTLSSDQAYVDVMLEQRSSRRLRKESNFDIVSDRRTLEVEGRLGITNIHQLRYKGETIFQITTRAECDGMKLWGNTSTCVLTHEGYLRVKVSEKRRRRTNINSIENVASKSTSSSSSTVMPYMSRTSYDFLLEDLVRKSASGRQQQLETEVSLGVSPDERPLNRQHRNPIVGDKESTQPRQEVFYDNDDNKYHYPYPNYTHTSGSNMVTNINNNVATVSAFELVNC